MTGKQQKIGLLSSSAEESALAVNLPHLDQITANAPLWLVAMASECIPVHSKSSISPDRPLFHEVYSFTLTVTVFFNTS